MVLSKTIPAMRTRLLHLTAVAALWAASGADAQPRSIHADCGSVAFGGSGIGNTVKIRKVFCGIPPEQFEALVQERTKDKTRGGKRVREAKTTLPPPVLPLLQFFRASYWNSSLKQALRAKTTHSQSIRKGRS